MHNARRSLVIRYAPFIVTTLVLALRSQTAVAQGATVAPAVVTALEALREAELVPEGKAIADLSILRRTDSVAAETAAEQVAARLGYDLGALEDIKRCPGDPASSCRLDGVDVVLRIERLRLDSAESKATVSVRIDSNNGTFRTPVLSVVYHVDLTLTEGKWELVEIRLGRVT